MTLSKPSLPAVSPPLPCPARLHLSLHSLLRRACLRPDGTLNRCLLSFFDFQAKPNSKPDAAGVRTADFTLDPSRPLWFRLFIPTAAAAAAGADRRLPVIVYFHGGGFYAYSPASRSFDSLCRRLAASLPAVVVSVNYRRAPEHRCPAPYDDGTDVLRFLDSGGLGRVDSAAAELADLGRCFLAGDSAGGNISHHVARRWAAAGDWATVRVPGMVLVQPAFGSEERTESQLRLEGAPVLSMKGMDWSWRAFLPEGADRDHEAANVFGPRASGELEDRFPPAMVVIGGYDPLVDVQRGYCKGLRERGKEVRVVEFPDSIHAFQLLPQLTEETARLVEETKRFVDKSIWSQMN